MLSEENYDESEKTRDAPCEARGGRKRSERDSTEPRQRGQAGRCGWLVQGVVAPEADFLLTNLWSSFSPSLFGFVSARPPAVRPPALAGPCRATTSDNHCSRVRNCRTCRFGNTRVQPALFPHPARSVAEADRADIATSPCSFHHFNLSRNPDRSHKICVAPKQATSKNAGECRESSELQDKTARDNAQAHDHS